ncbi:MAG: hypothetical protein ACRCTZ_06330 [Sarcina sp.]
MGVSYKLSDNVYHEVLRAETLSGKKENDVSIIFYNDKIEVKELDVKLRLDRRDIKNVVEGEHTVIETFLGYNIIILNGVIQNKNAMMEYLNLYLNEVNKLDGKSIRIDTVNKFTTIKMNNSTIEFDLKKIDEILEDDENLYFSNKTILFEKIKLPKFIFEGNEDKEKFLASLEFKKIKFKRAMKKMFLK